MCPFAPTLFLYLAILGSRRQIADGKHHLASVLQKLVHQEDGRNQHSIHSSPNRNPSREYMHNSRSLKLLSGMLPDFDCRAVSGVYKSLRALLLLNLFLSGGQGVADQLGHKVEWAQSVQTFSQTTIRSSHLLPQVLHDSQ